MRRTELLRLNGTTERDPAIEKWMSRQPGALGETARRWFDVMRDCGDEFREVLHDGCPAACLGNAAFGYVNVFTAHVNVGFYQGSVLPDPQGILEGSGKFMRHVKARLETPVDAAALTELIRAAYADVKESVENG